MRKGISGKGWRCETKKFRWKKKGGVCMEYYQEMVETEHGSTMAGPEGISCIIHCTGTGIWNLIW